MAYERASCRSRTFPGRKIFDTTPYPTFEGPSEKNFTRKNALATRDFFKSNATKLKLIRRFRRFPLLSLRLQTAVCLNHIARLIEYPNDSMDVNDPKTW